MELQPEPQFSVFEFEQAGLLHETDGRLIAPASAFTSKGATKRATKPTQYIAVAACKPPRPAICSAEPSSALATALAWTRACSCFGKECCDSA